MNNSILFKKAHKMTKLTIKPNETYRYKFGQWLIFLKTAMSNQIGITNINQSVCYVPVLSHDGIGYNSLVKTSYIKDNTFLLCLLAIQLLFIVLILNHNFIA
jgi:hypothetical protein